MTTKCLWAIFLFSMLFSACANYQVGGYVQSGIQALLAGNNETALSYFQAAAQQDPTYMYGGQVNQGVLSYLGRAQYLTRNYAQGARLWRKRLPRTRPTISRDYIWGSLSLVSETQRQALIISKPA
jgi:hypothetical protein